MDGWTQKPGALLGKSSQQVASLRAEEGCGAPVPHCGAVWTLSQRKGPTGWGGRRLVAGGGPELTEASGLRVPICEGPTAAFTWRLHWRQSQGHPPPIHPDR